MSQTNPPNSNPPSAPAPAAVPAIPTPAPAATLPTPVKSSMSLAELMQQLIYDEEADETRFFFQIIVMQVIGGINENKIKQK